MQASGKVIFTAQMIQDSESFFQECKRPKCPRQRSNQIGFISKTTRISMTDFIGRLMKNPVRNDIKEADMFSLLTDITPDGDIAGVCSLVMTYHLICEKCFLYRDPKMNSHFPLVFHKDSCWTWGKGKLYMITAYFKMFLVIHKLGDLG